MDDTKDPQQCFEGVMKIYEDGTFEYRAEGKIAETAIVIAVIANAVEKIING